MIADASFRLKEGSISLDAEPTTALKLLSEPQRLTRLAETELFDSPSEEAFDRLTKLAARLLSAPTALVSLVDDRRQFFKASVGLPEPVATRRETPLSHSFCKIVVTSAEPLVVEDARADPRVAGNPAISDLGVIAYLGFPLRLPSGDVIGSLCVIDTMPRQWTPLDISILADLASAVEAEIALRLKTHQLTNAAIEAKRGKEERSVLLNAIGEGVYGVDAQGCCTFANRAALEMLGYELSEVLGRDMHTLIHYKHSDGRPYPKDDCPMLHAVRTGQAVRLEKELLWRKDGSCLAAEYCSYPVVENELVVGSVLTFIDTTHRDDAQKRLAVQYAVSQVLMEALPPEVAFRRILAEIGTGFGWEAGAFWNVEGSPGHLTCASFWSTSEALRQGLRERSNLVFEQGEGLPGRVWENGTAINTEIADAVDLIGSKIESMGQHAAFAFPIRTGGETLGVLEFFTRGSPHLSELLLQAVVALGGTIGQFLKRVSAEEALRVSRRAIEAVNVGVTISDATMTDMPLVYCNPAFERMTGYDHAQSIGRNCRFLQGSDTDQHELEALRRTLAARENGQFVLKNYRADGSYFWNELTISPVTDEAGLASHFVGVQVDITERLRNEAALAEARRLVEEASEAKSQFIANMSHELRTPLSAIIGYVELLDEEAEDLGERASHFRNDISRVHSSAHHLLNLINGVLDISKIEAGKLELEIEQFDVNSLIQDVVQTISPLVKKNCNSLDVQVAEEVDCMHGDRMKVTQCLLNLLSNAAKFTSHGVISLSVQQSSTYLVFAVRDTGVGMNPAQVAKLFDRFSQADASTTRRFGGTGLGLALTKAFADIMGGSVIVRSVEGNGTTFELKLPVRMSTSKETLEELVDESMLAKGHRGRRVVVIDDDPAHRDLIGRFLAREGIVASFASDGVEGIRLCKELQPSAILLDVHMPRMDGWTVLTALKASPDTASLPVIMITVEHDRARGLALGADDYFTKPLDWTRLHRALLTHIPPQANKLALVVQREGPNRADLEACLEEQGWTAVMMCDLAEARKYVETTYPTLCIVDVQEMGADGLKFLNEIQSLPDRSKRVAIALAGGDPSTVIAIADDIVGQSDSLSKEIDRLSSSVQER